MRIYLVSRKNDLGTRRYIVMTFSRHSAVLSLRSDVRIGATVMDRHEGHFELCSDEGIPSDLFDAIKVVTKTHGYLPGSFFSHITFTPINTAERNWLIVGGGKSAFIYLHGRICGSLRSRSNGIKWDAIITSMTNRLEGIRETQYLTYHRNAYRMNAPYSVRNYLDARDMYKDLGKLVRDAIKNNDTGQLAEFIVGYDEFSHKTFQNIDAALSNNHSIDLGVTLTDCDHLVLSEDVLRIGRNNRDTACDSCHYDNVVHCEDGGYEDWRDNLYYHERNDLYYSYEEEEDDDYDSDDNDREPDQLMSYSTNVLDILEPDHSIVSSTHGDFRMGIELEMCTREISVNSAVRDVRAKLGEEYCIVKADGSLPSNGMEIVSAPRGLAEHIKRFTAWDIDTDYRAWNTGKCGMHIHVHSKAFTGLTLGKFLMIVNSDENSVFIRQIAGRHPLHDSQARDYCASEQQEILDNPVHAIKGKYSSRYRMVNCENLTRAERDRLGLTCDIGKSFNTIELRIFKASLKKTRLLAQIEFTHALVMFCRVASWRDLNQSEFKEWHENRDLKQPSFIKWLKSTNNQYPNLCDWYGIRRRPNAKNSAPTALTCADTNSSI